MQNMCLNGYHFHANKRQMLFEIAIPSVWTPFCRCENPTTSAWLDGVLAAEMLGGKSGIVSSSPAVWTPETALCLLSMVCIGLVSALLAIVPSS